MWQIARSRAKFKRSLGSYSIVIPFLWVIWFLTSQDKDINRIPWPIWPMLGWGVGLTIQYLKAYVIVAESLEQQEYDKLKGQK